MRTVQFVSDVQFTEQSGYCLCYRPVMHIQVLISFRLKDAIERRDWSNMLSEDGDELRSLLELGFLMEEPF